MPRISLISKLLITIIIGCALSTSQVRNDQRMTKEVLIELFNSDDNISATERIIKNKNEAIPALRDFMYSFSLRDIKTGNEVNRLYGLFALEGIETIESYDLIKQIAAMHPETEIKGKSLQILSNGYYSKVVTEGITPSKDIILLLLQNCDDTSFVEVCKKRIGEISREGLKKWIGLEYGDLESHVKTVFVTKLKKELRLSDYREWWWSQNSAYIQWNSKLMQFLIQKK